MYLHYRNNYEQLYTTTDHCVNGVTISSISKGLRKKETSHSKHCLYYLVCIFASATISLLLFTSIQFPHHGLLPDTLGYHQQTYAPHPPQVIAQDFDVFVSRQKLRNYFPKCRQLPCLSGPPWCHWSRVLRAPARTNLHPSTPRNTSGYSNSI